MTIDQIQDEIIEEFAGIDDAMMRYHVIMDMGNDLPALAEEYKTDQYRIEGCQSSVWLHADYDGNVVTFEADSNTAITKGIVAMLVRVLSGHTPDEILASDLHFIDAIGLKEQLSPTRSNGLVSMVKQMRLYAVAFKAKGDSNIL